MSAVEQRWASGPHSTVRQINSGGANGVPELVRRNVTANPDHDLEVASALRLWPTDGDPTMGPSEPTGNVMESTTCRSVVEGIGG